MNFDFSLSKVVLYANGTGTVMLYFACGCKQWLNDAIYECCNAHWPCCPQDGAHLRPTGNGGYFCQECRNLVDGQNIIFGGQD